MPLPASAPATIETATSMLENLGAEPIARDTAQAAALICRALRAATEFS
jgi:hypothetical protein